MASDSEVEPMTREEAKRILRRLELDAYSAIVTAFRAQGDINKSKKSLLNELSNHLSISTERHRAEVRRVVNDDRLDAIAGCMHGPGTDTEWSFEGRRLVSLMPRLVPQTVFTAKATAAANQAIENNKKLPIKTEIEVLPLPTKPKQPPKNNMSTEPKDEKSSLKSTSEELQAKLDEKLKKKKKPNILYTKPSPLALNKTLNNPFKPSNPATLKPLITNNLSKQPVTYSIAKTTTTSSHVNYTPKPIILQRSPTKTQPSYSRPPSVNLQSLNSSNVNTPLTSLSNLGSNRSENSLHLIQSPMIRVVSSSLQTSTNATSPASIAGSLQSSCITQKIKFKTPLPKPKVKATKFKPMVPLQKTGLLASQISEGITLGTSVSSPISASPSKSIGGPQGVSVKVVQVAKSGISATTKASILNSNKPVVVSSNKNPSQRILALSSVSTSVTQQLKPSTSSISSTSITQTIGKGSLPSKSMPLATGFKMIAVTTVVPGTTQVKTVYIATPIMSLNKTVSQTTGTSITTPSTQNAKHTSSCLASNLQSVVARSMNSSIINQVKTTNTMHPASSATLGIATPSIALGKTAKINSAPRGLGSLKTTLPSSAQSLKLFTTVSKSRTPSSSTNHTTKHAPFLPSTNLLSSIVGSQTCNRIGNIQIKNSDPPNVPMINDKQQVLSMTHQIQSTDDVSHLLSISSVGATPQQLPAPSNSVGVSSMSSQLLQPTLTLSIANFDDVNSTLNLLAEENAAALNEQLIVTTETDEMAFLNAGEKFLEQLSAKMTANSPDSLTKGDGFIFPNNLSIELGNETIVSNQVLFDAQELEINSTSTSSVNKNLTFSKNSPILPKETNYLLHPKTSGAHNVGVVTSKVLTSSLGNNISIVNSKVNLTSSHLGNAIISSTSSTVKTFGSQLFSGPGNLSVAAPNFKNKTNSSPTILNYKNITRLGKVETQNHYIDNPVSNVGFINVGNSFTIESSMPTISNPKLSSRDQSNKLQMSIPGSSKLSSCTKLNIAPILTSNTTPSNSNSVSKNDFFTQICTSNTTLNSTVHISAINSLSSTVMLEPSSTHHNTSQNFSNNNKETVSIANTKLADNEFCNGKKRKFNETNIPPARTQASWVRGAANLLARVSRFRGTNKQKGEMNAASWFTKPVDPNHAPGYYRVIKNPMDFGKIKRKLEDGDYEGYPHFYEDMLLIKKNCYQYNADGSILRKDCDDVFSFFESEYQKLLERWEKHHVSPPKKVKITEELLINSS